MAENYLITGGAGFIGSHFVKKIIKKNKTNGVNGQIIVLDAMTYASDLDRLKACDVMAYRIIKGNIRDSELIASLLKQYEITRVVHFAAETHVDRSFINPNLFLETNVLGTFNLVDAVNRYWISKPEKYENKVFLQISTDEVYGAIASNASPAHELSVLNPGNPYAASKAAADQIILSMINAYNFPAFITRSSNNFGAGQHPEKLIPKMLACLREYSPIPIYGEGTQMRCWLNVETYCELLLKLLDLRPVGETFNIRGFESYRNLELAQMLLELYEATTAKKAPNVLFVQDREAHDVFYNICDEKLKLTLKDAEELLKKRTLKLFLKAQISKDEF